MAEASPFTPGRSAFHRLGSAALVVAALYWGQRILMLFALAVLLAFVLTPPVSWLEQRGLSRISSVLLVVCLAFLLLGAGGWAVMTQSLCGNSDFSAVFQGFSRLLAQALR